MSSNSPDSTSRRDFVKLAGYAAVLAPLAQSGVTLADELPKVDEADPAAVGLGYHHNVADVDREKFPRSAPTGDVQPACDNCALYQGGADDAWGPCSIFPGKTVNAKGWCNVWAPKA